MKVALVIERVEVSRGGAETSTRQFIGHLLRMGLQVELFTLSSPDGAPEVKVHTVPAAGMTRARRSESFLRETARLLGDQSFDVVHAMSPCMQADVYEPRGGTIVETTARNLALRSSEAGRSLRQLTMRFNRRRRVMLNRERELLTRKPPPVVVALSDYVIRQLREHYDFPKSQIRKIFNGVDPDNADPAQRQRDRTAIRARHGIGPDDLLVLLVAHNFKLKGVARWIDAAALLAGEGEVKFRSLVVGKGRAGPYQRRAESAGVADRVRFAGPTDQVAAFYHAADLLVHPTYYDPCSRVVLEALASGLPVVTTRFDGAAEAVDDGVSGYVLESPEDVAALADRVRLLAEVPRRREMGARASEAGEQASMEKHAEQMGELYQEVVRRRTTV